ncbi:Ig-like domain-containing protein [Chitinophagaceae bacterium LWZ2-11]
MKRTLLFLIFIVYVVPQVLTFSSCASIIPPGGGPRDTIPPHLLYAVPKDSGTNVKSMRITLTFDEYVEVKSVQENLIVSPIPKNLPIVDYKLRNITIKLRDSLQPNTTYSLNFGNSIKDINEGNVFKEFTYVFSTGNKIDSGGLHGKVILAETGKLDSTLIVVLYNNLDDTAVLKTKPRYYAKLDGKGNFSFHFLPKGMFNAFVMPNDYSKKYDDSTKIFGFLDHPLYIGEDSVQSVKFYAYQEFKRKEKTSTGGGSNTNKQSQPAGSKENKEDKRLHVSASLESGQQDLLKKSLDITYSRKLKVFDSTKFILTDTSYQPLKNYSVSLDTTLKVVSIKTKWQPEGYYRLIVNKEAAADTNGIMISKSDTLRFTAKKEADYGSVKIRFKNLDLSKNPVLQIIQTDQLIESVPMTSNEFVRKLFKPGDYELRILYDKNKNGIWDPGDYKKKLQPEIVVPLKDKFNVRADWDNEPEYVL